MASVNLEIMLLLYPCIYCTVDYISWHGAVHSIQAELTAWRVAALTNASPSTAALLLIVYVPMGMTAVALFSVARARFRLARQAVSKRINFKEKTEI